MLQPLFGKGRKAAAVDDHAIEAGDVHHQAPGLVEVALSFGADADSLEVFSMAVDGLAPNAVAGPTLQESFQLPSSCCFSSR